MAAEFYRKSTALYEEFKKRELHYLNVERSINSNYKKNETNLPLEDYLEKINKREKESEKSYRDLLKHLEEMDKRTDQMSLKLDKLNALRNAAISSNITNWSTADPAFNWTLTKPYYGSAFLQSTPTASFYPTTSERTLQANLTFNYPSSKTDSRSQWTQTDHIFCDKCHYPFTKNSILSIDSTAIESVKQNETLYTEHMANIPLPTNLNQDIFKEIVSSVNANEGLDMQSKGTLQSPTKTSILLRNPSDSLVTETNGVNRGATQNLNFSNVEETLKVEDRPLLENAGVLENAGSNSKEIATREKEMFDRIDRNITQDQFSAESVDNFVAKDLEKEAFVSTENNDCSKSKSSETIASKSDDESINHEFDFLESDRRPSMKNKTIKLEDLISNTKSDNIHENLKHDNVLENNSVEKNSKDNIEIKSQANEVADTDVDKNVKNNRGFLSPTETKIDSSFSEGSPSPAHHSEDISNHSESDSFSEKETPFTASAAYQALLGSAAAPKTVQKVPSPSDSDSEDEIENVVSTAVRRTSNINFEALTQVQKKIEKKASVPEVNPKQDKKAPKPASAGVSQNKLSKSTRKVLGLETSSGSEVELEVKPNASKIEEDSDEFDFYN